MSLLVASELRRYWRMKCAISLRTYIVTGSSSRDEGLREPQVDGIANHRGFKSEVMQRSLWCDFSQVIRESSAPVVTAFHFPDQYLAIRKLVIPNHTIRCAVLTLKAGCGLDGGSVVDCLPVPCGPLFCFR